MGWNWYDPQYIIYMGHTHIRLPFVVTGPKHGINWYATQYYTYILHTYTKLSIVFMGPRRGMKLICSIVLYIHETYIYKTSTCIPRFWTWTKIDAQHRAVWTYPGSPYRCRRESKIIYVLNIKWPVQVWGRPLLKLDCRETIFIMRLLYGQDDILWQALVYLMDKITWNVAHLIMTCWCGNYFHIASSSWRESTGH